MRRNKFKIRRIKRILRLILMPSFIAFSIGFSFFFFYHSYYYRVMNRVYNGFIDTTLSADFKLKYVKIHNCEKNRCDDIMQQIHYKKGSPLFIYDTHLMKERIEKLPFVKHVSVCKRYPHDIDIYIKERTPIAQCIYKNQYALVDETGALYQFNDEADAALPVVSGVGDVPKMLPSLFKAIDKYPDIRKNVKIYQLVQNRRIDLIMQSGQKVMLPQYEIDKALCIFGQMKNKNYSVIDLRVKNYIYLR